MTDRPGSLNNAITAACCAAALAIVLLGWALYDATRTSSESQAMVQHTEVVLATIADFREQTALAESGQRGFLLSGEDRFLRRRDAATDSLKKDIAGLSALVVDNPAQQDRVARLSNLVDARVTLMQQSERLRRTQGSTQAGILFAAGSAELANARLRQLAADLAGEEQGLLAQRREQERQSHLATRRILVVTGVAIIAFVLPVLFGFLRQSRARQRAESRLRDIAESLPGAVYLYRLDPDGVGRYEFLSSNAEQVRGINRDEVLLDGSRARDVVVEEDRDKLASAIARSAADLADLEVDFRVRKPDGEERWVRSSAIPSRLPDGSVLWNGYWSDVTEHKALEQRLFQAKEAADAANRAKSVFLATMSHEIRTPMNGILGILELISLTPLNPELRTALEVVRESGKSLQRIIDDILDFSKVEAGKLEIRAEPTCIDQVIAGVHRIYAGSASSLGLELRHYCDPRISPAVMVDSLRLRQILSNFVSNAIKFTPRGHVEMRAELIERKGDREHLRFIVSDTGIGVSPDAQQRLFQPFEQAENNIANRFGGTGLGLAISRRLAELMGGEIGMTSELGKGTTMCLELPVTVTDAAAIVETSELEIAAALLPAINIGAPTIAQAEAEGTLVLVVDDHPTNRMVMRSQLNILGYAAEVAEDGGEALALWESGRYALVLTDCNMPELSGYELSRRIRAREAVGDRRRTAIIACSANALGGVVQDCLDAGMDDYIVKPTALVALAEKMKHWLPLNRAPPPDLFPASRGADHEAGTEGLLDEQLLQSVARGEPETVRRMLEHFRRVNEADVRTLREAVAQHDPAAVTRSAHRIKGACGFIGATALAELCMRIEQAGRIADTTAIAKLMEDFSTELERLNVHIDAQR